MNSLYRIDNSCFIESQRPKSEEEAFFVQDFLKMKEAIRIDDHTYLRKTAKKFEDINAHFYYDDENSFSSYTLLHKAVKKGCVVCAEILLDEGAKTNIANSRGETAEEMAKRNGNQEVVALIEKNRSFDRILSVETVECVLTQRTCRAMEISGREKWLESYEGKVAFGPAKDLASVIYYRSTDFLPQNSSFNMEFTVKEVEHKGKKAYKICYGDLEAGSSLIITPNLEKYLIGKDNLFVQKELVETIELCSIS